MGVPLLPKISRTRQLATSSVSARCAMISAIDHLPGAGLFRICLLLRCLIVFCNFLGMLSWIFSGSWPSSWPRIRFTYCSAVSFMHRLLSVCLALAWLECLIGRDVRLFPDLNRKLYLRVGIGVVIKMCLQPRTERRRF